MLLYVVHYIYYGCNAAFVKLDEMTLHLFILRQNSSFRLILKDVDNFFQIIINAISIYGIVHRILPWKIRDCMNQFFFLSSVQIKVSDYKQMSRITSRILPKKSPKIRLSQPRPRWEIYPEKFIQMFGILAITRQRYILWKKFLIRKMFQVKLSTNFVFIIFCVSVIGT